MKKLKVIDLSTLLPGPEITMELKRRGAEVLRIEHPTHQDGSRLLGKTFYSTLNRGKRILKLDLASPAGKKSLLNQIESADVLVTNLKTSSRHKLGISDRTLHKTNPRLVVVTLAGLPGDQPGHDINFMAESGLLSILGALPGIPLADLIFVGHALFEILLLVRKRDQGTRNLSITLSPVDILKHSQHVFIRESQASKRRFGTGISFFGGANPCYGIYYSKDDIPIAVGAFEARYWERLCEILKLPKLKTARLATLQTAQNAKRLLERTFRKKSWREWEKSFKKEALCVNHVRDYREL